MKNEHYLISLSKRRTTRTKNTHGAVIYNTIKVLLCDFHVTDAGVLYGYQLANDGLTDKRRVLVIPAGLWEHIVLAAVELEPVFPENLE